MNQHIKVSKPASRISPPSGLYAITPDDCPSLLESVSAIIAGGARLIQYRDKSAPASIRHSCAQALLSLCHTQHVPLIINDDLGLALAIGADGVHLGVDDTPIETARAQFPNGLIGASCYNDFECARRAEVAGASYVAFGSFYPSPTKPEAVTASPELLTRARRELSLPLCAIGGIRAEHAAPLIAAGAHLLAVCDALFSSPDPCAEARAIAQQIPQP